VKRRVAPRGYEPPAIDGPQARANAMTLLTGARTLANFTAASLAHSCRLKPATAEQMLASEQARRARHAER
jgi:hypothetical protein